MRLNTFLQKWMAVFIPMSVITGFFASQYLHSFVWIITYLFAIMTFAGALGSNFRDLYRVLKQPYLLLICLFILHVFMPFVAFVTGNIVTDNINLITGLILAFVIPTGITSVIWVSFLKGNIAMTLSIILVDTILSPFLIPIILKLFIGTSVSIDVKNIMLGLLWMIVIPSIVGMTLNQITKGKINHSLGTFLSPFSKIGLMFVVAINSAAVTPYLQFTSEIVMTSILVLLISSLGYFFGWLVGKIRKDIYDNVVSLTYSAGMRNISVGAVIALTYFTPSVAVPVVVLMLFQQIIATSMSNIMFKPSKVVPKEEKAI